MMYFVIIYFIVINTLALIFTIYDKKAAELGLLRVSESTLMLLSFLGGSVIMYLTMRIIHHKTRHPLFLIGIPVFIVFQIIFTLALLYVTDIIG